MIELLVCNEGYFRWFVGLSPGASTSCSKLTYFAFFSVLLNIGPWLHGSVLFNSGAGKDCLAQYHGIVFKFCPQLKKNFSINCLKVAMNDAVMPFLIFKNLKCNR